ncbi:MULTISPECIES: hypothetical protein [Bacteria]
MTNLTLTASLSIHLDAAPPVPSPGLRVRLTSAGPSLWRVLDATGRIVGHLHQREHTLGSRWAARRYRDGVEGFRTVGEFWSVDEAVSALRNR